MRVRIYVQTDKGERHLDFTPSYKSHPSKVQVCTDGSFSVTVKELKQAVKALEALDSLDEED